MRYKYGLFFQPPAIRALIAFDETRESNRSVTGFEVNELRANIARLLGKNWVKKFIPLKREKKKEK